MISRLLRPVDLEIAEIRCNDGMLRMQLAHANETQVGQIRKAVSIPFGQFGNPRRVIRKSERRPTFLAVFPFSEGVALTKIADGQYQFIDKAGGLAIPGSFTSASSFAMGLAHVRDGVEYESATWAYIDNAGRSVFTYSVHRAPNR